MPDMTLDSHESVLKEANEERNEAEPDSIVLETFHGQGCILSVAITALC